MARPPFHSIVSADYDASPEDKPLMPMFVFATSSERSAGTTPDAAQLIAIAHPDDREHLTLRVKALHYLP